MQQRSTMLNYINDAKQILKSAFSVDDIAHKPIKQIWQEKVVLPAYHPKKVAWDELFINHRGQDFWTCDLLFQLTNANMVWETVHAPGDVAIFTGFYHAADMESILENLGFFQIGIVQKEQVELGRAWTIGTKEYDENVQMDLLDDYLAYDWMQK